FSSRRRHTRFSRDWSSDVCSSDLAAPRAGWAALATTPAILPFRLTSLVVVLLLAGLTYVTLGRQATLSDEVLTRTRELALANARSEERRVGKEGSSRRSAGQEYRR